MVESNNEIKEYFSTSQNFLVNINKFQLPKIYKNYNKMLPILTSRKPLFIYKLSNLILDYYRNKLTNVDLYLLLLLLEFQFSTNYDTTIYQYSYNILKHIIYKYKDKDEFRDIIHELKCIGYYTWKNKTFNEIVKIFDEFTTAKPIVFNRIKEETIFFDRLLFNKHKKIQRQYEQFINYLPVFINLLDYCMLNYGDSDFWIDDNHNKISFGMTDTTIYDFIIKRIKIDVNYGATSQIIEYIQNDNNKITINLPWYIKIYSVNRTAYEILLAFLKKKAAWDHAIDVLVDQRNSLKDPFRSFSYRQNLSNKILIKILLNKKINKEE